MCETSDVVEWIDQGFIQRGGGGGGGGNWDFPSQGPAFPPQEFEKNLLL